MTESTKTGKHSPARRRLSYAWGSFCLRWHVPAFIGRRVGNLIYQVPPDVMARISREYDAKFRVA